MSVIYWSAACSVGQPVGPIKVEHQENASSIAELTVQAGSLAAGTPISVNYNGTSLFQGVVDEAEDLGTGLTALKCTSLLQGKVNGMTRAQIDELLEPYSPWHPSLSDDVKQGWDYLEDRMSTFLGMVRLNEQTGAVEAHQWSSSVTTPPASQIIEDSYSIKTPPYRDLISKTVFEIEYRCETFEEARCYYAWGDDTTGWWGDVTWGGIGSPNDHYWRGVKFSFDLKLMATRPQAHEIWSMLQGTGWKIAHVDGEDIVGWRDNQASQAEEKTIDIPYPSIPGTMAGIPSVVVNVTPTVGSFSAWLVQRFNSEIQIEGEHSVGSGSGSERREKLRYRYEAERVSPLDFTGEEGTVRADWEDQLEQLPELDWRQDFTDWLNAHRYRAAKQQAEAMRGHTVTYQTACRPSLRPDGAIIRVMHELDADAGTAITEIEACRTPTPPPELITPQLSELRVRADWPQHILGTRTIHGEIKRPLGQTVPANRENSRRDEYGLIKTVNGYLIWGVGDTRPQGAVIINAAKNSFRLPRPEYEDTGPRKINLI